MDVIETVNAVIVRNGLAMHSSTCAERLDLAPGIEALVDRHVSGERSVKNLRVRRAGAAERPSPMPAPANASRLCRAGRPFA